MGKLGAIDQPIGLWVRSHQRCWKKGVTHERLNCITRVEISAAWNMIVTMRFALALLALGAFGQGLGPAQSDWPHHGGSQLAWRYSALDQVNTTNVKKLGVAWAFQTGDYGDSLQSTPIVIDGVMYVSSSYAQV